MTIETDAEQGTNVSKLEDLYAAYEKRTRQFHIDVALRTVDWENCSSW